MPWLTGNTAAGTICRRVFIPADINLRAAFSGALLDLTSPRNWEQFGTLTPDECAELFSQMLDTFFNDGECEAEPMPMPIGSIVPFASATIPAGMLECDGATYLTADFPALAAALDSAFIISPTEFRVPDLRRRVIIGQNTDGDGLRAEIGDSGGEETHTLTVGELAPHSHNVIDPGHSHAVPSRNNAANDGASIPRNNLNTNSNGTNVTLPAVTNIEIGTSGNGIGHNNMQPYLTLRYGIVATN